MHIDRFLSDAEYGDALSRASPGKRVRLGRLRGHAAKQRALLGELLARAALTRWLRTPADEIIIKTDERGKPYLPDFPEAHFNVSHSGRYVAVATDTEPIGIDVEEIRPVKLSVADREFAPAERAYVFSKTTHQDRVHALFDIWTRKEAYVKREGGGIGVGFRSLDTLNMQGVYFHEISIVSGVTGHVCSSTRKAPVISKLSIFDMFEMYSSNKRGFRIEDT
ncbi:MAG: 4'-phosphopantetheinyl transferase superfamily protein [Oscillospiraceae bacterium]|nr:4'-phosphopantetheinyl transferase superfamily protein [Oscillospiraceae bacterium]